MEEKREKKLAFPHTFVILACIIVLMTVCTYLIPAGSYERVYSETADRNVVDPNSFTYVDQTPVGLFGLLHAIPDGMLEVADIMVFIFVVRSISSPAPAPWKTASKSWPISSRAERSC